MKGKPESPFGRVCGGRRRPRDSGGEGEDGGLKGTEKGWCGGREGDVGEEKREKAETTEKWGLGRIDCCWERVNPGRGEEEQSRGRTKRKFP